MIDEEDVTGPLRRECVAWTEAAFENAGPNWHNMWIWIMENGYGIIMDVDPADIQEFAWESAYAESIQI